MVPPLTRFLMPVATPPAAALPRPSAITSKMEDRKRPAVSSADDLAPPSKRVAVNGSKPKDDAAEMKEEGWVEVRLNHCHSLPIHVLSAFTNKHPVLYLLPQGHPPLHHYPRRVFPAHVVGHVVAIFGRHCSRW